MTRDELHVLADISEEEGELEEDEEAVIQSSSFARTPVKDVMTPRTVTLAFDQVGLYGRFLMKLRSCDSAECLYMKNRLTNYLALCWVRYSYGCFDG